MAKFYKNQKFWLVVAGAAGIEVLKKILKADATRKAAVNVLANGMKLQSDAKENFQNMKDEASDLCYDAKNKAGLNEENEDSVTTEEVK